MDIRSYEFSTSKDNTLLKFPCLETDEDKMACSNSAPTDELQKGSNESTFFTSSFSQNYGDELCYSQAPSCNKPSNQADSVVSSHCKATGNFSIENKCSKPSYENNPIDNLLFIQSTYFSSL